MVSVEFNTFCMGVKVLVGTPKEVLDQIFECLFPAGLIEGDSDALAIFTMGLMVGAGSVSRFEETEDAFDTTWDQMFIGMAIAEIANLPPCVALPMAEIMLGRMSTVYTVRELSSKLISEMQALEKDDN